MRRALRKGTISGRCSVRLLQVGLDCLRVQHHGRPGYTYKAWAQEVKTSDGGIFAQLLSCYPLL